MFGVALLLVSCNLKVLSFELTRRLDWQERVTRKSPYPTTRQVILQFSDRRPMIAPSLLCRSVTLPSVLCMPMKLAQMRDNQSYKTSHLLYTLNLSKPQQSSLLHEMIAGSTFIVTEASLSLSPLAECDVGFDSLYFQICSDPGPYKNQKKTKSESVRGLLSAKVPNSSVAEVPEHCTPCHESSSLIFHLMGCRCCFVLNQLEELVDEDDSRSSSRVREHENFLLVSQLHVAIQTL